MSLLFFDNQLINVKIREHLDSQLKNHGDIKYAYLFLNKKNPTEVGIISNYPDEWVDTYKENNYQHIDPVVITAFNRVSPFYWDENIEINSSLKLSKIFNLSKKYNIINGCTFILHDYNYNLIMLSLMIDGSENNQVENLVLKYKEKLQMLLIDTHEKVISLCREINEEKSDNKLKERDIFSQRENEILYWASMGKTYQEIAIITDIKVSTVKFHMGNVVKKLGVLNAKHAIRLGTELQLIKPVE